LLKKVDPVIRRNTVYIACCVGILSMLMQAVYLLISAWNITVLLGNLLGAFAAVLNFFLMALTVQSALEKEPKDASSQMKASQSLRMIMLLVFCVIGAVAPCFDLVAVLIPLAFPGIAAKLSPLLDRKTSGNGADEDKLPE